MNGTRRWAPRRSDTGVADSPWPCVSDRSRILAAALLAVLCLIAPMGCAANQTQSTVDGHTIPHEQIALYVSLATQQTSSRDPQVLATQVRHDLALDAALFAWAKDEGYADYTTWQRQTAALNRLNESKRAESERGDVSYGVTSFTMESFRRQLVTQARQYLKDSLGQPGQDLAVSDAEAREYFDTHRQEWSGSSGIDVITVTAEPDDRGPESFRQALETDRMGTTGPSEHLRGLYPTLTWRLEHVGLSGGGSSHAQSLASTASSLKEGEASDVTQENGRWSCTVKLTMTQDDEADFQAFASKIEMRVRDEKLEASLLRRSRNVTVTVSDDAVRAALDAR